LIKKKMVTLQEQRGDVRSQLINDASLSQSQRLTLLSQQRELNKAIGSSNNQSRVVSEGIVPYSAPSKQFVSQKTYDSEGKVKKKETSEYSPETLVKNDDGSFTKTYYVIVEVDSKGRHQRREALPIKTEHFDSEGRIMRVEQNQLTHTSGGNERLEERYWVNFDSEGEILSSKNFGKSKKTGSGVSSLTTAQKKELQKTTSFSSYKALSSEFVKRGPDYLISSEGLNKQLNSINLSKTPKTKASGISYESEKLLVEELMKKSTEQNKAIYFLPKGTKLGSVLTQQNLAIGEGLAQKISKTDFSNITVFSVKPPITKPTLTLTRKPVGGQETINKNEFNFNLDEFSWFNPENKINYLSENEPEKPSSALFSEMSKTRGFQNKKVEQAIYSGGAFVYGAWEFGSGLVKTAVTNPADLVEGIVEPIINPVGFLTEIGTEAKVNPFGLAGQVYGMVLTGKIGGKIIEVIDNKIIRPKVQVKEGFIEGTEVFIEGKYKTTSSVEGVNVNAPEVYGDYNIKYRFQQPRDSLFTEAVDTTIIKDSSGKLVRTQKVSNIQGGIDTYKTFQEVGSDKALVKKYSGKRLVKSYDTKAQDFFGGRESGFSVKAISAEKTFVNENLADNILFQKRAGVSGDIVKLKVGDQLLEGVSAQAESVSKLSFADLSTDTLSKVNVEFFETNFNKKNSFEVVPEKIIVQEVKLKAGKPTEANKGLTTTNKELVFNELLFDESISKARGSFDLETFQPAKVQNVIVKEQIFSSKLKVGGLTPVDKVKFTPQTITKETVNKLSSDLKPVPEVVKKLDSEKKVSSGNQELKTITKNVNDNVVSVNILKSESFTTQEVLSPNVKASSIRGEIVPLTIFQSQKATSLNKQSLFSEIKPQTQVLPSQTNIIKSKLLNSQAIINKTSINTLNDLKIDSKIKQKVSQIQVQEIKQLQKTQIIQKTQTVKLLNLKTVKGVNTLKINFLTGEIVTPIIPFPPLIKKNNLRGSQGYNVFTKIKGKVVKVNPSTYSKADAERFGRQFVDRSPRASFLVKKAVNQEVKGKFESFGGSSKNVFGKSKKTDWMVEKNKFRINTQGEVRGISFLGLKSLRVKK